MSVNIDCGGCAEGDHDHHNHGPGLIPGVIGGQHCGCTGDCEERAEAEFAEFARRWPF